MDPITYNVPVGRVPEYKGRQLIVRSHDPTAIVRALSNEAELANVQFVQLLSADVAPEGLEALAHWDCAIPLDILVRDPKADYPMLYNFAKVGASRPIRVSISVKPGFKNAVSLSLALHFAVKLDVGQPDQMMVEEMSEVLDLYLHRPTVSEQVEFFHSVFLSFYREEELNLWSIQEEDPNYFRFIDDEGTEHLPSRLEGIVPDKFASGPSSSSQAGLKSSHDCDTCEFTAVCGGFFKWSDGNYDCRGVKSIFSTLKSASLELRDDLRCFTAMQKGESP